LERRESVALRGHTAEVNSIAWSHDGEFLASGSDDKTVRVWECRSGHQIFILEGHTDRVTSVSFSANDKLLASKSTDGTVRLWDCRFWQTIARIDETSAQRTWAPGVAFHPTKDVLASLDDEDRVIRLVGFDTTTLLGEPDAESTIQYTSAKIVLVGESNVGKSCLAIRLSQNRYPDDAEHGTTHGMRFWKIKPENLRSDAAATERHRREVVFWDMGGQDEYRLVHQLFLRETTLALLLFDPTRGRASINDVEVWNKRLEKQPDASSTTKLLVGAKIDRPTALVDEASVRHLCQTSGFLGYYETSARTGRGIEELRGAIASAIDWDRLTRTSRPELFQQIRDEIDRLRDEGQVIVFFDDLARTIRDTYPMERPEKLAKRTIRALMDKCLFTGDASDVDLRLLALPQAVTDALDWSVVARVARAELLFCIRQQLSDVYAKIARSRFGENRSPKYLERIERDLQRECEVFANAVTTSIPDAFDRRAVAAVTEQLAAQGDVADARLAAGERVLVLRIGEIENYAGSLIVAARNNPHGVPAIEIATLSSPGLPLPGIAQSDRLPRMQERVILECVVQLLLENGICFEHEGLLIFPTLFRPTEEGTVGAFTHSVSLCYDFSGAIDNIYASLIAWLVLCKRFGRVRMWEDRAEFDTADIGICGVRKIDRGGGFAHLDVYFGADTALETRELFVSFVEDHLRRNDMDVVERIELRCSMCQYDIPDEVIRRRIARGEVDIVCPDCETRLLVTEGARKARTRNSELHNRTIALRTRIEESIRKVTAAVKQEFVGPDHKRAVTEPIRILHLSDLHIGREQDVSAILEPLVRDLRSRDSGLGLDALDFLVVSGDMVRGAQADEFEVAQTFVGGLIREFKLTAQRLILVPGNHDLSWDEEVYEWRSRRRARLDELSEDQYREAGEGYLVREDGRYPMRFRRFSDHFFHPLVQRPYPLEFEDQGIPYFYKDLGVQFVTFNSCWAIDELFPSRSGLHPGALTRSLRKADEQLSGQGAEQSATLRVAVWHHPLAGTGAMADNAFLEQLQQADVRLVLHGHVHEERAEVIGYQRANELNVVGAGSFGAPSVSRPESTPQLYNLLEVARDHSSIRVHTRAKRKVGGAWSGWAVWTGDEADARKTSYTISLARAVTPSG
jgi:small GTP-binding protein